MKVLIAVFGLVIAAAAYLPSAHADETAALRPGGEGRLCYGVYEGQYSNGVRARFFLDGHRITIKLGDFLFTGHLRCDQWGRRAEIRYRVQNPTIPGTVFGNGQIFAEHHGAATIGVNQNNGLSFNGWRR